MLAQPDLALARRRHFELFEAHHLRAAGLMNANGAHGFPYLLGDPLIGDLCPPPDAEQAPRATTWRGRRPLPVRTVDLIASRPSDRTGFFLEPAPIV